MSCKRPGMSWSSILKWIRMIDRDGKLWLSIICLLLIAPMICTGCKRIATGSPKMAEEEDTEYGDFTMDNRSIEEARQDLIRIMKIYEDIYKGADKGEAANVVLADHVIHDIQKKLAESGLTVYTSVPYQNMLGGDRMDQFLNKCKKGMPGSQTIFRVNYDGGLAREEYRFDGIEMQFFSIISSWDAAQTPVISQMDEYGINEWYYSSKGYFGYQLDVPEPPEVSEIIDGSVLIRILPLDEKYISYSRKYILPIGYAGNNLLSSDWDADHMEEIDYNGLFESFYRIEYGYPYGLSQDEENKAARLQAESSDPYEISQKEFERLMTRYLPVSRDQVRKYAAYDNHSKTYPWEELGCMNYAPTSFGTSLPEVVDVKENPDQTLTLTIDAVCDHVICDDDLITSELTVQINDKQEIRYLANHVIFGNENIPEYQYRVRTYEQ